MRFRSSESLPWTLSQLLVAVIRSGNIPESAILAESQVVREAIRIPGSGIRLVYHSSRAKGFYSTIQLQLTPATVPQSLLRVHLQITIEGRPACCSIGYWCRIAYPILFRYLLLTYLTRVNRKRIQTWVLHRKFLPEKRQNLQYFCEHQWKKQRCGFGSVCFWESWIGSFYLQAKVVRKTFIPTVLWLLNDFLFWKMYCQKVGKKQKKFKKIVFVGVLKVDDDNSRIRIRIH